MYQEVLNVVAKIDRPGAPFHLFDKDLSLVTSLYPTSYSHYAARANFNCSSLSVLPDEILFAAGRYHYGLEDENFSWMKRELFGEKDDDLGPLAPWSRKNDVNVLNIQLSYRGKWGTEMLKLLKWVADLSKATGYLNEMNWQDDLKTFKFGSGKYYKFNEKWFKDNIPEMFEVRDAYFYRLNSVFTCVEQERLVPLPRGALNDCFDMVGTADWFRSMCDLQVRPFLYAPFCYLKENEYSTMESVSNMVRLIDVNNNMHFPDVKEMIHRVKHVSTKLSQNDTKDGMKVRQVVKLHVSPQEAKVTGHATVVERLGQTNMAVEVLTQIMILIYWLCCDKKFSLNGVRDIYQMLNVFVTRKPTKTTMKIVLLTSLMFSVSSEFCSIEGSSFDECVDPLKFETIPIFRIDGNDGPMFGDLKPLVNFIPGNDTGYRCSIGDIRSRICETYVQNGMVQYVNGDANFISQRGAASEPRNCYCIAGTEIFINVNSDLHEVQFIDFEMIGIHRIVNDFIGLFSSETTSNMHGPFNYTHHYDHDDRTYKLNTNDLSKKTIEIRKRHCFDILSNVTSNLKVKFGECYKKTVGPVRIVIKNSTHIVDEHTFRMKEYNRCDDFIAMFSSNSNFNCHDSGKQAFYILGWIAFGLAIIIGAFYLYKGFKILWCKAKKSYKKFKDNRKMKKNSKLSKKMSMKTSQDSFEAKMGQNNQEEMVNVEIEKDSVGSFGDSIYMNSDVTNKTLPEKPLIAMRRKATYYGPRTSNSTWIALSSVGLIAMAYGCDIAVFTNSDLTSCNTNTITNTLDCVPGQLVDLNLEYAGQTACLNIQTNTNTTMSTFKIKLKEAKIFLIKAASYWTSFWELVGQTVLHCKATSNCDTGVCGTLSYSSDHTLSGQITSPSCLAYPGFGACEVHDTSSIITCGSEENCYYWCDGIVPDSSRTKEFFMIGGYRSQATIQIFDSADNLLTENILNEGDSVNIGEASVTFNAFESIDFDNILPSYYNVFSDEYMTYGSVRGVPEKNLVGDIQAIDEDALIAGDFTFANDILISHYKDDHTDTIIVTANNPGIDNTDTPRLHSGDFVLDTWSYDEIEETWSASIARTVSADISFLLPSTLIISEQLNEICPVLEDKSVASGCYDCESGFTFNITVKSRCMSGTATLTCDDITILNPILDLTSDEKEFEIFALSTDEKVDTTCHIDDIDFELDGELSEISDFTKSSNNVTTSNDKKDDYDCSGDFISKTLDGCGTWYDILFTVLLFVLVAILLFMGLGMLAALIWIVAEFSSILFASYKTYRESRVKTQIPREMNPDNMAEMEDLLNKKSQGSLTWRESMRLAKLNRVK